MQSEGLGDLRTQVRAITLEIFENLARRSDLVKNIREMKRRYNLVIEDPKTEEVLRREVLKLCGERGLDRDFAARFLNLILSQSIQTQKEKPPLVQEKGVSLREVWMKARRLERRGRKIVHLEVGEPDFGPPRAAKSAITKALSKGYSRYTESAGIFPLRQAIAEYLNRKFHLDLEGENVAVTVGSKLAVYAALVSFVRPGGRVIVFEPSFPGYGEIISQLNARTVPIETSLQGEWLPDLRELRQMLNDPTDLIILNNPNNPTGRVLPSDVLDKIVEIAERASVPILSDEVYSDFCYTRFKSILEYGDNFLYTSSFSKSFGMTGFRIGYAVSSKEWVDRIARLQAIMLTSPPEFIQRACIEILNDEKTLNQNIRLVKRRLQLLTRVLEKYSFDVYPPQGALYAFPRLGADVDAGLLALRLLDARGIAIAPGESFGPYPDFARIAICQPEAVLERSVRAIRELLN
jgi:aspartate aminotransferase